MEDAVKLYEELQTLPLDVWAFNADKVAVQRAFTLLGCRVEYRDNRWHFEPRRTRSVIFSQPDYPTAFDQAPHYMRVCYAVSASATYLPQELVACDDARAQTALALWENAYDNRLRAFLSLFFTMCPTYDARYFAFVLRVLSSAVGQDVTWFSDKDCVAPFCVHLSMSEHAVAVSEHTKPIYAQASSALSERYNAERLWEFVVNVERARWVIDWDDVWASVGGEHDLSDRQLTHLLRVSLGRWLYDYEVTATRYVQHHVRRALSTDGETAAVQTFQRKGLEHVVPMTLDSDFVVHAQPLASVFAERLTKRGELV